MALLGVKLNNKHSLTDYGMYLYERSIGYPEPRTDQVDIPGADGLLDFTGAGTGSVKFRNRTLGLTFHVVNGDQHYETRMSTLAGDIHGKRVAVIFDDDPNYAYLGRAVIDPYLSGGRDGTVAVKVDCDPYRYGVDSTRDQDWRWDELFNCTIYYGTFDVSGTKARTLVNPLSYSVPVLIICSAAMTVTKGGTTYNLTAGTNENVFSIAPGDTAVTFTGNGRVVVDYAFSNEEVRVL